MLAASAATLFIPAASATPVVLYNLPLWLKFGITGYSQIQAFGQILPQNAGEDNPASTELTSFDGIASFIYPNDSVLMDMLAHPYYPAVVANDEAKFIDKKAHNGGQVAVFVSKVAPVVGYRGNDNAVAVDVWAGEEATKKKYQALFDEYNKQLNWMGSQ
uniref:EthD domain-containing protein n=1 Tax=Pyricularia oryzae (strain P131) TaxID=1143193 RepID=L7IRG5_PYRO1